MVNPIPSLFRIMSQIEHLAYSIREDTVRSNEIFKLDMSEITDC